MDVSRKSVHESYQPQVTVTTALKEQMNKLIVNEVTTTSHQQHSTSYSRNQEAMLMLIPGTAYVDTTCIGTTVSDQQSGYNYCYNYCALCILHKQQATINNIRTKKQ